MYDIIKQIADAKGISIRALERALDFSNGTLVKWNASSPSVKKLQKVAVFLGVPIEQLIRGESNGKKHVN